MRALLLALFLAACGPHYPSYPRQQEAVDLVWSFYALNGYTQPDIHWVEQSELNCAYNDFGVPIGFWHLATINNKDAVTCVLAVSIPADWTVLIGHPDVYTSYAWNYVLPHELYHYRLLITTGDGDAAHKDPGFEARYGHPPGGLVEQAADRLTKAGL